MGHLLNLKYALVTVECAFFGLKSVPFRQKTVKMPNLALIETKRITVRCKYYRAGIFNQSMGARKGVGMGMSYRPASTRLHSLSELVSWNRFLGSLIV
jgi:hypothetical protein